MPRLGLVSSLTGGAVSESFVNSYSLSFDGTNDYIDSLGNCPAGNATLSAWGYMDAVASNAYQAIYSAGTELWVGVAQGDGSAGYGSVRAHIGGQSQVDTAGSTFTNEGWHHVVVTWDGTNTKIYTDGVLRKTSTTGDDITATAGEIGIYSVNHSQGQWIGEIDEVSLWSEALDLTAIQAIYNSGVPIDVTENYSDNLVSYWRFEEGTGTTVADSSGNGNDGDINNATWSTDVPS